MAFGASFSSAQQIQLNHFFTSKRIASRDWNELPEEDPIWETCLATIRTHYQTTLGNTDSPFPAYIVQLTKKTLDLIERSGKIKQFFQEHLLTSFDGIENNIQGFADATKINQRRHYVCLIPSIPGCVVELDFLFTNTSYPIPPTGFTVNIKNVSERLEGKLELVERVDILLDDQLENQLADRLQVFPYLQALPSGGFSCGASLNLRPFPKHDVVAILDPVIQLPRNQSLREQNIHSLAKKHFRQKYAAYVEPEYKKRRNICLMVSVCLVAGLSILLASFNAR